MEEKPLNEQIAEIRDTWLKVKDLLPSRNEFKSKRSRAEAAATLLTLGKMLNTADQARFSETEDFKHGMITRYLRDLSALVKWLVQNPDPDFQASACRQGRLYIDENADIGITILRGDWKFIVYRAISNPKAHLTYDIEDEDDTQVEAKL